MIDQTIPVAIQRSAYADAASKVGKAVETHNKAAESAEPLYRAIIPKGTKAIVPEAFKKCTELSGVIIPDSVTEIGWNAFLGCTGLKSVTIPDSVTRIGNGAFYGCTGLTGIVIPDSVTEIGRDAFLPSLDARA